MTRLGLALGARADTFMGLSGLGDLVLTATGDLSRNRRVGVLLACRTQPLHQVTGLTRACRRRCADSAVTVRNRRSRASSAWRCRSPMPWCEVLRRPPEARPTRWRLLMARDRTRPKS